eukprot:12406865-Karenia_brevis.AAC.1
MIPPTAFETPVNADTIALLQQEAARNSKRTAGAFSGRCKKTIPQTMLAFGGSYLACTELTLFSTNTVFRP